MLDQIAQLGVFVFGTSAIILLAKKNKWGFVVGLISQPFYFITSYINHQWGIFIVSVFYTGSWLFGIYEWFFRNKKKK